MATDYPVLYAEPGYLLFVSERVLYARTVRRRYRNTSRGADCDRAKEWQSRRILISDRRTLPSAAAAGSRIGWIEPGAA